MPSAIPYILTALAILAASGWLLLNRTGEPLPSQPPEPSLSARSVPAQFQSGNSRFSRGTCKTDSDCITGGCSGEVCMSADLEKDEGGSVTTCEYSESFPSAQGYSCGCVPAKDTAADANSVCGWK